MTTEAVKIKIYVNDEVRAQLAEDSRRRGISFSKVVRQRLEQPATVLHDQRLVHYEALHLDMYGTTGKVKIKGTWYDVERLNGMVETTGLHARQSD